MDTNESENRYPGRRTAAVVCAGVAGFWVVVVLATAIVETGTILRPLAEVFLRLALIGMSVSVVRNVVLGNTVRAASGAVAFAVVDLATTHVVPIQEEPFVTVAGDSMLVVGVLIGIGLIARSAGWRWRPRNGDYG